MAENEQKIVVVKDGPYMVQGSIPLVRKSEVMSEYGEPLTWRKNETIKTGSTYALCRCGKSEQKPFCDGTHSYEPFDSTEMADPGPSANRQTVYSGTGIQVQDDRSLCMHAGFCGNRVTNIWEMTSDSQDKQVCAQIMSMIEKCPSGALAYTIESDGESIEPDLPVEIAVTPDGALWVSGNIAVERADGLDFEVRNRVTLCRCGRSKNKPLCDGAHKDVGFKAE